MPRQNKGFVLILPALLFSLASCSGRISGAVQIDEAGEFIIEARLAPTSAKLLAPMSPLTTGGVSAPILDASIISLSLSGAPGISSIKLNNTSREAIAGSIGFARISDFLSAGNIRFVTWEQSAVSGRAVFTLDRTTAPQMIAMLSQDVADYLSAVMAPIATGESLTKQQYLALVSGVYGAGIAREIESAEISASINFPGIITQAQGASYSGSTARFRANLAELLTLEKPIIYEVKWTPFR